MKQERAVLTRGRLLRGAAGEFARQGYAGTSLQDVCHAAGVSMGALTFHFSSKYALAEAVAEAGAAETREAVTQVAKWETGPLLAVARLTCDLAALLALSPVVRATARLEEELGAAVGGWRAVWRPAVGDLLERARMLEELTAGVEADIVAQLTERLLLGAAAVVHAETAAEPGTEAGAEPGADSNADANAEPGAEPCAEPASLAESERLARIWGAVMHGVRASAPVSD